MLTAKGGLVDAHFMRYVALKKNLSIYLEYFEILHHTVYSVVCSWIDHGQDSSIIKKIKIQICFIYGDILGVLVFNTEEKHLDIYRLVKANIRQVHVTRDKAGATCHWSMDSGWC